MATLFAHATSASDGANVSFSIPFPYLRPEHVVVQLRSAPEATPVFLVQDVDYHFTSTSIINLTTPAPEGFLVDRIRSSGIAAPLIPFGGGTLTKEELQINNLQLIYLIQEAEDLALSAGGTTTIITDPGSGGGGGGGGQVPITTPQYGFMTGTGPPFGNLVLDEQGHLGEGFARHLWLDMFYVDDTTTDTQALLNFAALFNAGTIGDCTLNFMSTKGRGPLGRFLIDQEILFTGGSRLVLDFHEATVRFTAFDAKFRYKAPFITGNSGTTPIHFFIVRNAICQYATAVDCLFYWDFPYVASRDMGTGYAENVRAYAQDGNNAAHTINSIFRTKNAWYWSADRVHAKASPRTVGNYMAGTNFLRQEGLCVAVMITRCELEYFDVAIVPGIQPLVGVNGTFSGGASYTRYKGLKQGANQAIFGRNDNPGGHGTYALFDEVGTLVPGPCEMIATDGTISAGTFTITSVSRFGQASEAISVSGGTTIILGNYMIDAVSPDVNTKFLEWNFEDMHINLAKGAIRVNGIADLQIGQGVFGIALAGTATPYIDVTNGDNVVIAGLQYTSSDSPNMTCFKGRNITEGSFSNNNLFLLKYAVDLDNTVKSFKVHSNSAYELTTGSNPTVPTFLNTGNRLNAANTRGIDFKSNGRMGRGFDTDDNHMLAWAPVPTAQDGSTLAYTTTPGGGINVNNGILTFAAKLTITNTGGAGAAATNAMYLSFPVASLLTEFGVPASALTDFLVNMRISNVAGTGVFDQVNNRILVVSADPANNPNSAFKIGNNPLGTPYVVLVQSSVPIQYD
jgi:hypothetical protein